MLLLDTVMYIAGFAAILVCSLVLPRCDTTRAPTSCTTSPGVEGQPASVTCQFQEDLAVDKLNFRITRYDFDGLRSLPGKCVVARE